MKKISFFKAAILIAAFILLCNNGLSQSLLLLNSGRDYCYIFSVEKRQVLNKYRVCEKKASVTDIVPLKNGFLVIPHRMDLNVDATELYVYNRDFSKILKKIPVGKSPYKAFFIDNDRVLINHTFFAFDRRKFIAEIVNLKKLTVEKTIYFDGIPAGVIKLFNSPYAVIEDVRGVIGGIRLVSLVDGRVLFIPEKNLSSNIVECNGALYCAVNGYGKRGFANSLFRIYPVPMADIFDSIEKVKEFENSEFPYILGNFNSFLIVGFTNHSVRGNYNKLYLFNTDTGKGLFLKCCYGPECMVEIKGRFFIAGVCSECLSIVSTLNKGIENIKISDSVPGFSSIRVVH